MNTCPGTLGKVLRTEWIMVESRKRGSAREKKEEGGNLYFRVPVLAGKSRQNPTGRKQGASLCRNESAEYFVCAEGTGKG